MFVFFCLTYLTQYGNLQSLPCCFKRHYLIQKMLYLKDQKSEQPEQWERREPRGVSNQLDVRIQGKASVRDYLQVGLIVSARSVMLLQKVQVSIKLTPSRSHTYSRDILSHTVTYCTVLSQSLSQQWGHCSCVYLVGWSAFGRQSIGSHLEMLSLRCCCHIHGRMQSRLQKMQEGT